MRFCKKLVAVIMLFFLSFGNFITVYAIDIPKSVLTEAPKLLINNSETHQIGGGVGDWGLIALARYNYDVPDNYFSNYYIAVEEYVKNKNGKLHETKYTEYSYLVLAITAIGKNPENVAGYNLLLPLADFQKTILQGINGPIFALLAFDSKNYEIPISASAKVQATRDLYIDEILKKQLKDGGFALSGEKADPDITGMVLQALAKYQSRQTVKQATDKALACLSKLQNSKGGFTSWGDISSESTAQVINALCELGISMNDARFVKNGNTLLDNLLSFYKKDSGFLHTPDGAGISKMSTAHAVFAIFNYLRTSEGKSSIYRMNDATTDMTGNFTSSVGLSAKHADVMFMPVIAKGKSFSDIKTHANRIEIEALAAKGIISGVTSGKFAPENAMTRAQFAAIVVKSLGLTPKAASKFSDVTSKHDYREFIGTAVNYGIVTGLTETTFGPDRYISRQQAAVMVMNAAKLCGINVSMTETEIRNTLAQFPDYTKTEIWARQGLAFCFKNGILSQDMPEIGYSVNVKRCDIAVMLYNMLKLAKLL